MYNYMYLRIDNTKGNRACSARPIIIYIHAGMHSWGWGLGEEFVLKRNHCYNWSPLCSALDIFILSRHLIVNLWIVQDGGTKGGVRCVYKTLHKLACL